MLDIIRELKEDHDAMRRQNDALLRAFNKSTEHLQRLLDSAKIHRIEVPYSVPDLAEACFEVVHGNGLSDCYIRPMVLRGYGAAGMDALGRAGQAPEEQMLLRTNHAAARRAPRPGPRASPFGGGHPVLWWRVFSF